MGSKFYILSADGSMDVFNLNPGTWTVGPRRRFSNCAPAYAILQSKLYLAGCRGVTDAIGPLLVFNPATNLWNRLATLLIPSLLSTGCRG